MKIPSTYKDDYWIYTSEKERLLHSEILPEKVGKWLIFIDRKNIDEVWLKIKKASEKGFLGIGAKVSTAKLKKSDIGYEEGKHVICVYTYDWTDEKDVMRVRDELRKLGITSKIPYKTDKDTLAGKYKARGHTRISKYYT